MYIDGKLNFEVGGHIIQIDHDAFTTAGSIFLRHKNSNNYVPIDISEAYNLGVAIINVAAVALHIQNAESNTSSPNTGAATPGSYRGIGSATATEAKQCLDAPLGKAERGR